MGVHSDLNWASATCMTYGNVFFLYGLLEATYTKRMSLYRDRRLILNILFSTALRMHPISLSQPSQ